MTDLDGLPSLTYVLQFRRDARPGGVDREDVDAGRADPHADSSQPIHEPPAFSSGMKVTTRITDGAVIADATTVPGDVAVMQTTVVLGPSGEKFRESGTITFEGGVAPSQLSFDTVGAGTVLGPVPGGKLTHGVVNWRITGGTGQFDGASGTISSSFLFDPQGEALVDNHLALVWLR